METTVSCYQCVRCFDLLNVSSKGTPALFLIQLPFHDNLLERCVTDERYMVGFVSLRRFP